MAWFDNIKNAMRPYDDDYIENEERAAEEDLSTEDNNYRDSRDYREPDEDYEAPRRPAPKHEPRRPAPAREQEPAGKKTKLNFYDPTKFEEVSEIADKLKSRQSVFINFEQTDPNTARRVLDFLSGSAYALGGRVMRVSSQAYIVAPSNVDLVGDAVQNLENAGLNF